MVDSGSEVNLLKISTLPSKEFIDKTRINYIKGIGSSPRKTLGVANIRIVGHKTEFMIVPDNFPILHTGILGMHFFSSSKSRIDFNESSLHIQDKSIKLHQNELESLNCIKLANIKSNYLNTNLPFLKLLNDKSKGTGKFLIDTGAEANLIKMYLLPENAVVNTTERFNLRGVGSDVPTIGTVRMKFLGTTVTFHVIPDDLDIPGSGISGVEFCTQVRCVLDFEENKMHINDKSLSIIFNEFSKEFPVYNTSSNDLFNRTHDSCSDYEDNFSNVQNYLNFLSQIETIEDLG